MEPNILWIGLDQMRADSLGANGGVCQTPNLDRLAAEGTNFNRAYTPCSLCTPARASMLTGQYAFRHGMGTNCDMYQSLAAELPRPQDLLHHRLRARGYRTGYTGKWHVGKVRGPADYNFEGLSLPGYGDLRREPEFQAYLRTQGLRYGAPDNPVYGNSQGKTLVAGEWKGSLESTPTYYLTNRTLELLDNFAAARQAGGQPFFLTCQYWAPHPPYLPSPEYVGLHPRADILPWPNFEDDFADKPQALNRFRQDFYRSLPQEWDGWQEIVGLSYDFTTMVDAQIGRLLDRLDELGLREDTAVFVSSDHGDMLGSHGGLFDKGFLYEEAHRVPLIVRLPGQTAGGRQASQLVYNMDIVPTVLDLAGEEPDETLHGRSLLPWLNNTAPQGRDDIYLEFHGLRCLHTQRGLVTNDGWKYIFNPTDEDEVYDLNTDPAELHNLRHSAVHADRVQDLQQRLLKTAVETGDPVQDYAAKLFGTWQSFSGQPDASTFEILQQRT